MLFWHSQKDVLAKLSTSDAGHLSKGRGASFPWTSFHSLPAHFKEVMCPGVLLCPKLPPSTAGDLFEVSVVSAVFSSHILLHCRMTQTVMSESCLKVFNPKDHAVMAQNYRWISQPSLTEISTSSPCPLLFVAFKGSVVADNREEAIVWGRDSGYCWEGKCRRGKWQCQQTSPGTLPGQTQVIFIWLGEAAMRCSSL